MSLQINYPAQASQTNKSSTKSRFRLFYRLKFGHLILITLLVSVVASSLEHGILRTAEQARYAQMAERDRKNNPGLNADTGYDRLFESVKAFYPSLKSYSPTSIHPVNDKLTYLLPVDFDRVGQEPAEPFRDNFASDFKLAPAYQLLGKYHYLNSTECSQPFEGVVLSLLSDQGPAEVNEHWEVLYYLAITGNQKNLLRQELADGSNPAFNFTAPTAPWVINIEPPTPFRKRGVISVISPVSTVVVAGTTYPQSLVDPEKVKLNVLVLQFGSAIKSYSEAVTAYNSLPSDQKTSEAYAAMDSERKALEAVKLQMLMQIRAVQIEDSTFDYKTLPIANYIK